ncbi:hypothetical protein C0058_01040 [Pseudomonas sp. NC02]|nr:hypothetical protein C0058_01040 [Pseudomonas sp. NC02]
MPAKCYRGVERTIPRFFIPEQYFLFTLIFHFAHAGARLAGDGGLEPCDAPEDAIAGKPGFYKTACSFR